MIGGLITLVLMMYVTWLEATNKMNNKYLMWTGWFFALVAGIAVNLILIGA